MIEEWRYIRAYEGLYKVSNFGAILSCRRARLLRPHKDSDGYLRIGLWDGLRQRKYAVHKLVAEAFLAQHKNALHCEVAHLDNDRANPRADNLQWVSKVENHSHKRLHGTHQTGEMHPRARLTEEAAAEIRAYPKYKIDLNALAARFGVSRHAIDDVRRGKNWRFDHG